MGSVFAVMDGLRPAKPNNALAIGFSDPLWAFVQRCWDANMKLRPRVAEVVAQLSKATADWDGVMPTDVKAESEEPTPYSDSMKHREFGIWILPGLFSLNDGAGGIFDVSPDTGIAPEDTTNSKVTFSSFTLGGPPSTQFTEPAQELRIASPEPWIPTGPNEEPQYPHLGKSYVSPPSLLPQKRWRSFRYLKHKFRKFFRF